MQTRTSLGTTLFPLVLAGLLTGMTYWLDLASRPLKITDGRQRHDPDYIVENFEVRRFGPEGGLQHTLRATRMLHYPDDDSTEILAPDLTYHREPPSRVTARMAKMSSEGKHVELIDDVRVVRGAVGGKPETVLTTTRLDAWPDDEIASNREPVTIVQGQSNVHGSRMHANNKTAIYVLEGPVRGIFHRNAKPAAAQPAAKTVQKKAAPAKKPRSKRKTPAKRTS
jgi:lipopolysaccharide export system protein LptC